MKKKQFYSTFFRRKLSLRLQFCSLFLFIHWLAVAQTPVNIPTGKQPNEIFDQTGSFAITYGMLDRRLDQVTFLGLHNADITSGNSPDFPFTECSELNQQLSYWAMIHGAGVRFFDMDAGLFFEEGAIAQHGCGAGHKDMGDIMNDLKYAMDNAPNTVYIMTLTDMQGWTCNDIGGGPSDADRNRTRAAVIADMQIAGLWDRVYNKDAFGAYYAGPGYFDKAGYATNQSNWLAVNGWPTLRQMIASGRNIFLMDGKDPAYSIGGPTGAAFDAAVSAVNTYMNMFELGKTKDYTGPAKLILSLNYGMQANSLIVEDDCTASDIEEDIFVNSGERVYQHLVEAQKHFESQLEVTKASYPQTQTDRQIMILPIDWADVYYDYNSIEGVNKFNMERCGYDYYNLSFINRKMYPLGKGKRYKVTWFDGNNIPSTISADSKFGNATNYKERVSDGNLFTTTFYNSNSLIVFDVEGGPGRTINEVDIAWFLFDEDIINANKVGDFNNFTLEESNDAITWTNVSKVYDNSRDISIWRGERTWWRFNLPTPITKRYVRISNFAAQSISEISFLDNTQSGLVPCPAPTGGTVSFPNAYYATVSWTAASDAVSYTFEYKRSSNTSWTIVETPVKGTSFTMNVVSSFSYDWRVKTNCAFGGNFPGISSYLTGSFLVAANNGCLAPDVTTFTNSAITTNSATLSWGAIGDAVSYTVDYGTNISNLVTAGTTTATSVNLTGLTPNTGYIWRVRSNCTNNSSGYIYKSFSTTSVCLTPSGLSSSAIISIGATVSWAAVSGALNYAVDYKTTAATTWTTAATNTTATSVNIVGLSASTAYDWRVRTNCSGGSSVFAQAQFTTQDPAAICNAPSGLSSSAITSSGATISWTAVSGALNYNVEYKTTAASTWAPATANITSTSVSLFGLSASTAYDWRVRTNCAGGSSGNTVAQFTTTAVAGGCGTAFEPNETQATARAISFNTPVTAAIATNTDIDYYSFTINGTGDLTITLTNLPVSEDYDLELYNAAGTRIGASTAGAGANETISRTSQAAGTYYIRVLGYNGSFNATQCYTLNAGVTVVVAAPCADMNAYEPNDRLDLATPVASSVTLSAGLGIDRDFDFFRITLANTGNIDIRLTNVPVTKNYDLELLRPSPNVAGNPTLVASSRNTGLGTDEVISLTNQPPGFYCVRVYGADVFNDFSSLQCYTLTINGGTPCTAPSGLASSALSSSGATVSWAAVSGALNYTVEYKTTAASTWTTAAANTTATSANIVGLSASTAYDWRVRTNCSGGSSGNTVAQFTTGAAPAPCNTPSGLSSSAISSSGATVSWGAVSGASNYTVEYKTSAATNWNTASASTTATSVDISGLTASTGYDWRVRTNCASGSSAFAQAQFTTGSITVTCSPWTPNLSSSNITANSALLSWASFSGATGYTVEIRQVGSVDWGSIASGIMSTSVTPTNLSGGTIYNWRVQGSCANGGRTSLAQGSFTTACPVPVSLAVTDITNVSVTLNWNSPALEQVSRFTLEYKLVGSSAWTSRNVSDRTTSLTNLTPGSVYDWRVSAACMQASIAPSGFAASQFTTTNSSGSSCATAFEPNNVDAAAAAITANTTISAAIGVSGDNDFYSITTGSASDLNITLSAVPSGIDYELELLNSAGAVIARSTNNAGLNEVITRANQPAGVYYIRVLGYGSTDFSASQCYSLFAGVTPVGGVACNAATGLSSSALSSSGATVSWSAAGGALNYTVDYKTTAASSWITAVASTTSTTATLTGLAASTVYDWRVRTNCSGNSATAQAQFTTTGATPPCAAPAGLASVPNSSGFGAGVSWTGVSGVTYTLEYKAGAASAWTTVLTNANTTSATIGSLTPSTAYDWRVSAQCSNGGVSTYTQAQFTTSPSATGCTGAYEANEQASTAAPIAVNTAISAAIGNSGDNDFYAFNVTNTSNLNITLTGVPAGIDYDLQVNNNLGNTIGSSTVGAGSNETVTLSNVGTGTYYIRIFGYGAGDFSTTQCYTLTAGVTAVGGVTCGAPASLSSSSISNTGATVSWTAVSGVTNYEVGYKLTTSANWTLAAQSTTATSFTLSGLGASSAYDWRVRAFCSGNFSIYSSAQFTTTAAQGGCATVYEPNESQAAAVAIPLNTPVTAAIGSSGDNDYYQVTLGSLGNLNITLTNVPAGIDYELYLYNAAGVQIGSSTSNAGVNESISLSNQPANIYYVRIYGYRAATDFHATQCYTLNVGTGAVGTQSRAALPTSIVTEKKEDKVAVKAGVALYPNPVSDLLTIVSKEPIRTVKLLTVSGQKVAMHNGMGKQTLELHVGRLVQGVYLVQVTTSDGTTSLHKVIKK